MEAKMARTLEQIMEEVQALEPDQIDSYIENMSEEEVGVIEKFIQEEYLPALLAAQIQRLLQMALLRALLQDED